MKKTIQQTHNALFIIIILSLFSGCAGFGVVATSDPHQKLSDAEYLFDKEDRPLIAERLIREAIDMYQKQNNEVGLADGYREYGFFFRSPSIEGKWNKYFREHGFLDKTATFDNRYSKSIEYFDKSRVLYQKHEKYDALTNVDLNRGFTFEFAGDRGKACSAYNESAEDYRQNLQRNPEAKINLPQGYSSYEDYIAAVKKHAQCK